MKKLSRREFIKGTVAAGTCACCTAAWGTRPQTVYAQSSSGNGNMAVFLNQFGGNDSLNSFMVPYGRSAYYDRRPSLAIAAGNVLPMNSLVGLNPVLPNIHALFQQGDVAVIQGAGDPRGTRSHFTSQEIFSRGTTQSSALEQRGWIGRLGDLYMHNIQYNTLGIGVGSQTDFNSDRSTNRPIIASGLSSVGFDFVEGENSNDRNFRLATSETFVNTQKSTNAREASIRLSQKSMFDSVATLQSVNTGYTGPGTAAYGGNTGVARYFRDCAAVGEYGLGTQVCYGGIGGWDTHSNQASGQAARLSDIDDAVAGLHQDMQRIGKWNDTCICIFTEFGRKTFENGSAGTDHGWGGAMVLIGGGVNGGVYGSVPSNTEINGQNWLYMDIDFRNVFSEIVSWLGYNPTPVFPESYSQVNIGAI